MSKNDADSRVEPVAIIGMGCRFPGGANTPEAFWELLQGGQDVIRDIPATRWNIDDYYDADPNAPGKMYVRKGYFLDDEIDQFDPQFFNLTPREVAALDPQQRLALEVSWEALEHANIAPGTLAGSQTGIFVSSFWDDYSAQRLYADDPVVIDRYATLSNLRSMISGRLAHLLDVHGPNFQIDTTCSGSLTALHLACQSLRNQECNLALTGGVCLSLCPEIMIGLSRMGALSADGYCKTFDQQANGFGLGEGCGMVLLKRLSTAQADGDDILAVIRGSAINHDGHSRTVTTPNGLAHQMLLRQALQQAAVTPQQVQYIEAHGTGTELGDPIEVFAIAEVYCDEEREAPLALGSVKTNIGHLNAAAGVASLIKVVLSLQHGEIPPTLHQKQANSRIPWQKLALTVPDQMTPWLSNESPRIAGLSAFGMNGSNAHCIVEQAPVVEKKVTKNNSQKWHHHFLPLSAKTSEALQAQVERYRDYLLKHPETCFADICYTAAVARDHFPHRLAVVATSAQEATETLESIKQLSDTPLYGQVSTRTRPKVGFLFTGQGAQYVDMGRELYETQPGFRATLEYCDEQLKTHFGESLLAVLYPEKQPEKTKDLLDAQSSDEPLINQTRYTQPALFALEYALAKLWQSWGVQPNVLIGHSIGELVAACIAGVFSLDDGLKLIAARARLMDELPSGGEMLAVLANETLAREVIAAYPDEVSLASINGPENVVISGRGQAIQAIAEALTTRGIKTRRLVVSHAFHSPLMEPMLEKFRRVATTIRYHKATLNLVSNVTGQLAGDEIATADYWVEHVGKAVRFADGVATLHEKGIDIFLEIGPKPILLGMAGQVAGAKASPGMLPSLREGHSDWQQMLSSVGELYVRGFNINRENFDAKNSCHKVVLPTYPFQRERYWVEPSSKKRTPALRPLIDTMTRLPLHGEVVFEKIFSVEALPFLADHCVYDTTISPAACQLVMVLGAAELTLDTTSFFQLKNVVLPQPLVVPDGKDCTVQTVITANDNRTQYSFKLISFDSRIEVPETATHAVGDVVELVNKVQPDTIDLNQLRQRCDQVVDISPLYNTLASMQIELGPCFRWLARLWQKPDGSETLAKLLLPETLTQTSDYLLHPGLLDACFQAAGMIHCQHETMLPFSVGALRFYRPAKNTIGWCHSVQTGHHQWDIHLLDEQGRQIIAIEGFEVRAASSNNIQGSEVWRDWLYQVKWQSRISFGQTPDYLPGPDVIVPKLQACTAEFWEEYNGNHYQTLASALNALSVEYVLMAFTRMGIDFQLETQWSVQQIEKQAWVIPACRRLLNRLLSALVDEGILQQKNATWRVIKTVPAESLNPAARLHDLQTHYGDAPELIMLARCGEYLADVLQGEQEPLALLFPDGDSSVAIKIYSETAVAQTMNRLMQGVVKKAVALLPPGRGLSLLEIGAGTGGTTAGLLSQLPADKTDYLFTDIGPTFLTAAQERFTACDFVRYQILDIEQSPLAQGFSHHQTDLVVAVNVLHATRNLEKTLSHIRQLLLDGGQLLLIEVTDRDLRLDLTFGLTDGWWRFDDSRKDYPLLSATEWEVLLLDNGFQIVESIEQGGQAFIVAQMAHAASSVEILPDIAPAATHLLFADKTGVGEALANQLRQQGEQPVFVYAAKQYQQIDAYTVTVRPDCVEDYQRLLAAFPDVHRLVHLWSLDLPDLEDNLDLLAAAQQGCGTTLDLLQALLQTNIKVKGLYLVTRDAQMVSDEDSVNGASQSAVWGMAKVIAIEHPELNCVCIDLEGNVSVQTSAMQLCAEMRSNVLTTQGEAQIALRRDARYVARLTRFKSEPKTETTLLCQSEATYLITGGLGGLGLLVAQHLVAQGARHLLLLGRSKAKPEVQLQLDALMATGVSITVAQVDVTQLGPLAAVVSQVDKRYPLRGVIHSVGVLDDGILLQQNRVRFATVLAPKIQGAGHLHQLTKALPLDFFVLFSSITSLLGTATQANHAAANAFLDAFSCFRKARGLPSLTINWGAWNEVGAFAALTQAQQQKIVAQGMGGISSSQGIAAFNHLQSCFNDQTTKQVGVIPVVWDRFLTHNNNAFSSAPFYANFKTDIKSTIEPVKQIDIQQTLAALNDEQRTIRLIRYLQQTVAKIVRVSDPEKIDTRENFTELGLDSLMSIELTTRLAADFSVSLPGTLAFNHPSIEELGHYLINDVLELEKHETKSEKRSSNSELIRVPRTADPELSFVQKRIWFHQATDPKGCFHNLVWLLRFGGVLDVDVLQQSLNEVVRRHEILRTSFPLVENAPVQAISSIAVVNMIHHDLSQLTEQAQVLKIEQITQQDARQQSFDLATGPLLRATLIKQADDTHILLLCLHHTVIDFRSLVIFTRELCEIYTAFVQGEPSPLKELPVQYVDYAAWQHRLFTSKEQQLRISYWTEWWEKGPPPVLELPVDKPRQYTTFRAYPLPCQLPVNLIRQLKVTAKKENSTPFIMVLSTLSALLYRYSGCDDIVIGATFSNRNHPDLESMIGYIGSLLHLRIDLQGNPQLSQLLKQVRHVVHEAIACQDVPYQQIAEHSPEILKQAMTPFRVMLTFVPEIIPDTFSAAELDVSIMQAKELENRPDLVLVLMMSENKPSQPALKGFWRYRKDLFEKKTIMQMAENFQFMLESMVSNQGQTIDELPMEHRLQSVKKQKKKGK